MQKIAIAAALVTGEPANILRRQVATMGRAPGNKTAPARCKARAPTDGVFFRSETLGGTESVPPPSFSGADYPAHRPLARRCCD